MSLFAKKSINKLIAEANNEGEGTLSRTLNATSLVALGIGAIIGAGLFSLTGVSISHAGPGVVVSMIIAAIGCGLAGLCYAEFASMIPVAGSAYTYSYATMGEFIAWIIGWDLVLEYAVGAATVAASWSSYFDKILHAYGLGLPPELLIGPFESVTLSDGTIVNGVMNLPAVFIVVLMSLVLIKGVRQSAFVNNIIVVLKILIVLVFIYIGFKFIRPENLDPFIPENKGGFGDFGWSGVFRGAGIIFFAYIGFDAVSTAAQETKNPRRNMPIGILGSLIICTILYVLFGFVMTGVTDYTNYSGGGLAPVATAIEWMGPIVDGKPIPAYPWLNMSIYVSILLGYSSVILVMLLGQSRVFYSMSKDGLLPKMFSDIHRTFRTPFKSNLMFMIVVSAFAAFVPGRIVGEMTSIGTLLAFILVCMGVLIMRKRMKDAPRAFSVPWVPFVPILGIVFCGLMMISLPFDTWIRLLVWMLIGLDIYERYGVKKSLENRGHKHFKDRTLISVSGLVLAIGLCVLAVVHNMGMAIEEQGGSLYYFSIIFGVLHIGYFTYRYGKDKRMAKLD